MPQKQVDQVVLARRLEASVTVNLQGATVTSLVLNGDERLFLSKNTVFDKKTPINSGIPLILSDLPEHDFFRTSAWTVLEQHKEPKGDVGATFILEDSEETRKHWDHKFKATFKVTLKKKGALFEFQIENTDSTSFTCAPMFRNHFAVDDVTGTAILGLHETNYTDKLTGDSATEENERISITEAVDRLYVNTPAEHVLKNTQEGASLVLRKCNFPDTVIWNSMADEESSEMLCVGSGHVANYVTLEPGATFQASQFLSVK